MSHVVFGTGAIGRAVAATLHERGEKVLMVNRSGHAPVPDGVEVAKGDAADPAFTTAVAAGARVVYQTLNPPYHRWPEEFPALQRGVLAAAAASGARMVSMENVYNYGRAAGRPLTEDRPDAPHTVKGRLRAAMTAELLAEHRAGRVEVVAAKASDYFGPGTGAQSNLGDRVLGPALAGRRATVLGDPDQPHTYTYVPDIGRTLVELGERDGVTGRVWHIPNDPARTTRELVGIVQQLAGRPGAGLRRIPVTLLRVLGLWDPGVRAVLEMGYLFEEPFVVDSSAITAALGLRATPVEEALETTLRSSVGPCP
jgi:nucleoside-diphosphate-sugar epimerase